MSKSTTTTFTIAVILFLISLGILSVMVYQVDKQSSQLFNQVATLEVERAQEDSYYKLRRQTDETEVERALLKSYFLEQDSNSIDFLNLVESLAPQAGVSLKTTGVEVLSEKGSDEKWIEVTYSFSASRERIQNFVKILETLPYVLRLTSIQMMARSSVEWQAEVTLRIQVLNYDK